MGRYIMAALSLVLLAGCGGAASELERAMGLRIGIVTNAGVDDGGIGQDCYNGILDFIKSEPTASVTAIKAPDMSRAVATVEDVIDDYDVVVLPGRNFAPVGELMRHEVTRRVILVDSAPTDASGREVCLPNIYAMVFREQEGGFLAGIVAALETKSNKVAVVNGMPYPSNINYQYGFMSGVRYANRHCDRSVQCVELPSYAGTDAHGRRVGGNYVGAFDDSATGKVVGAALIKEGVDVLFAPAGAAASGVYAAAREASGVWLIGHDFDQYRDGQKGAENIMLTSILKLTRPNVTRQLQAIKDGEFRGRNDLLGVKENAINYVGATGHSRLSAATREKLEEVKRLLAEGVIVPASATANSPDDFPGI